MSEWISVKDKLPGNSRSVLVWCPERFNKYTAYFNDGHWFHFGGVGRYLMTEDVTHWMPTPDPPQIESSSNRPKEAATD